MKRRGHVVAVLCLPFGEPATRAADLDVLAAADFGDGIAGQLAAMNGPARAADSAEVRRRVFGYMKAPDEDLALRLKPVDRRSERRRRKVVLGGVTVD